MPTSDTTSKHSRIWVTGWGLVTPLGVGAWPTFQALLAGRTLRDPLDRLQDPVDPSVLVRAVGVAGVGRPPNIDPTIDLAERAGREAIQMAGGSTDNCGVLLATSKGAVAKLSDAVMRAVHGKGVLSATPQDDLQTCDDALVVALGPCGYLSSQLGRRLSIPVMGHVVAACASSLTGLHNARLTLMGSHAQGHDGTSGGRKRILVVTSEAALSPLFIRSYQRLGVLPPLTIEGYHARPLDHDRCGFMLGEIGAAVMLEVTGADARPASPCSIELIDTAVASDGHNLIRSSDTMPGLRSIATKLLAGRPIDLIHPHATGTTSHDPVELTALSEGLKGSVVNGSGVDLYASKGAIGHGLGASGLASLVIACMCGQSGRRPPMPWLHHPIADRSGLFSFEGERPAQPITSHAVFAAGFGGHVAGAVIATHR